MANPVYKSPPRNRLTVSSLLSPPEMKRSESFGSSIAPSTVAYTSFTSFASNSETSKAAMADYTVAFEPTASSANRDAYASPPISPYDRQSQKENMDTCPSDNGMRDPQLFVPSDAASSIAPDEPLFPQDPMDPLAQSLIKKHMESPDFATLPSKPAREDYELAVSFVSTVYQSYNKNPRAWFLQEREFDQRYGRPSGIQKRPALKKLAPAPSSGPRRQKVALPRLPRAPRAPKRTPQARVYDSFDTLPSSASPKPARPATNRDDTDYTALPDFSPPLESLPKGNNKILKADWKGQVLDLSNDPDRHLLHEAEVNLAATLRLSCATYLCSKRRIFQARIDALRIGKEFRKTDAQQACKIDVNKASKLWQAYEKVGWFKQDYFRQFV
ncbi:SWIRM domain-containing protein FUN19 [Aaosphaeria arxii CBS 175.79]|uniref:SWIRM domain-containing protein FUN19 n=1 Tax=Aaosphaeria arxii CBS 175.79 TaxID=1450172 RepID=A0A6A5XTC1_9PLEO|nr:SWIRM domain-containing protein FUN19 [Aaosphaeria arxii CBS 175.79]KAF2016452.1 SWIRM domain-containing protein FUN19 [Aaosphaeria arxii CBS 175.79]